MISSFLKAIASFFFAVIWFTIIVIGIILLVIPQLTVNAYGKNKDFIGRWVDVMEMLFDDFKEL